MIRKVLIANRGEIACRITHTCHEMGIAVVAVYSDADRHALHVEIADEALYIGPSDPLESYLNIPAILEAAQRSRADAIHPGFGFLAENAHFAEVCESIGVKFIGPTSENIALMGDKAKAREIVARRGLPVTPGSPGELKSEQEAREAAAKIGYPVIIKASAGGGGRGMRVVNSTDELGRAFQAAQAEAKSTFGNDSVYLERYFLEPRHIEVQIAADARGHVVYLGERDCSIQRRHQKLVEETPSPAVDEKLRREIGRVAVEAMKAVHYRNLGTVEFLLDKDHNFFFMEVNTRIQVEHRVSELCYALRFTKPDDPNTFFDVTSLIEAMAIVAKHKQRLPQPTRVPRDEVRDRVADQQACHGGDRDVDERPEQGLLLDRPRGEQVGDDTAERRGIPVGRIVDGRGRQEDRVELAEGDRQHDVEGKHEEEQEPDRCGCCEGRPEPTGEPASSGGPAVTRHR